MPAARPTAPDPDLSGDSIGSLPQKRPTRFRTSRTVFALFIREMTTTYGRSTGGYLWAIVEPIAGILLLTLLFSLVMRSPSIGTSFPLFYASGYLPFSAFMDVSQKVSTSVRFSKQLLNYPGVTFMDAVLARFLLNALTQAVVFVIVLGGIILLYDLDVILDYKSIALGFLMAMWLAMGIGVLNCYLLSIYPVWERTWSVLTRPLFLISGVIFIFDDIPQPYQDWLWWNPLIHVVGMVRNGVYSSYDASYVSMTYVVAVGGVCMMAGLLLLRRYYRDILLL